MKISVSDLKKAIKWIESYSNDTHIQFSNNGYRMWLEIMDKYGAKVTITLFEDSTLLPKIQKEEVL